LTIQFDYGGAALADWATDESGSSQTISYSATNELNQYEVIQRPNPLLHLVQGFAHPDATVEITLSGGEAGETVSQSLRWGPGSAAFAAQAAVTLNAQAGWRRVYIKASRPGLGAGGATLSITRDGWLFFPPVNETLSYDLDGNLTADARWTYGWDGDNRLIWMEEKPIAGTGPRPPRQRLEYDYDSQSRRIAKRVLRKTHELGDWSLHQHRQFLYDGWNMIGELDVPTNGGTAHLHRSYAWGLDASGTRTGAGGVGGLLLTTHYATPGSGTSSNVTLAPLYDLNANVLAYADVTTSTITHRIDYDPFGNELTLDTLLPTAAAEEAPRFRFSTKYTDSESGLVYYGFRSYSPELGRWVNRDPIEERGGVNLYGMVGNDAVNRWDLLGMWSPTPRAVGECEVLAVYGHGVAGGLPLTTKGPCRKAGAFVCIPGDTNNPIDPENRIPNIPLHRALIGPPMTPTYIAGFEEFIQNALLAADELCGSPCNCGTVTIRIEHQTHDQLGTRITEWLQDIHTWGGIFEYGCGKSD